MDEMQNQETTLAEELENAIKNKNYEVITVCNNYYRDFLDEEKHIQPEQFYIILNTLQQIMRTEESRKSKFSLYTTSFGLYPVSNCPTGSIWFNIDFIEPTDKNKWRFVVFQEDFFARNRFVNMNKTNGELCVQEIVEGISKLSRKHDHSIFFVNFSHEFNIDTINNEDNTVVCNYLCNDGSKCFFSRECSDNKIKTACESVNKLSQVQKDAFTNSDRKNHFANYCLVIYNGGPIAIYRKSSYFKEDDSLLKEYFYEMGNSKVQVLNENIIGQKLFNSEDPLCNIFICRDLNAYTYKDIDKKTPLNIVQSSPFGIHQILYDEITQIKNYTTDGLAKLFQNNSVIIQADSKWGGIVAKFGEDDYRPIAYCSQYLAYYEAMNSSYAKFPLANLAKKYYFSDQNNSCNSCTIEFLDNTKILFKIWQKLTNPKYIFREFSQ